MTTVGGQVVRGFLNRDSFADLAPGVEVTAIARDGIAFAGSLTPEQACNVWWRFTSRDAADEAARRNLAALKAAANAADLSTPEGLTALREYAVALGDYTLGSAP